MKNPGSKRRRTGFYLGLDVSMFLLVCMLMCLSLTGLRLHEWLGFVLCALVLWHVTLQWRWFTGQFHRFLAPGAGRAQINFWLNGSLLVMMAALLASGILVSHQLSPVIGEHFGRRQVWSEIHDNSNIVVMILAGLHLGLNWDWVAAVLRRRAPERPAASVVVEPRATSPGISPANFAIFFTKSMAICAITSLVILALYLTTSAVTPPTAVHAPVQNQLTLAGQPAGNSGKPDSNRGRAQTRRGFILFGSTLLGVIALATAGRYVFRLHL